MHSQSKYDLYDCPKPYDRREWREAIQEAQQNRVETQTVLREQKKDEMRNEAKRRGSRR